MERGGGTGVGVAGRRLVMPRLLGGFALQAVGQSMGALVVGALVWGQTRSMAWLGVVTVARLGPYLLGSVVAGALVDRCGPLVVLRRSIAVRTVLVVLLAAMAFVNAAPIVLVAVLAATTLGGLPAYPAMVAATPRLLPPASWATANALSATAESLAFLAGPAVGAMVLGVAGAPLALIANAAVLAAALVVVEPLAPIDALHGLDGSEVSVQPAASRRVSGGRPVRDLLDALRDDRVSRPLLLVAGTNAIYGASLVLVTPFADQALGATPGSAHSVLSSALGIGACVAVIVVVVLGRRLVDPRTIAGVAAVTGAAFALVGATTTTAAAAALLVATGVGCFTTEVLALTVLQQATAPDVLGRIVGLFDAVVVAAVLVGAVVSSLIEATAGPRVTLVVLGLTISASAASSALWIRPSTAPARGALLAASTPRPGVAASAGSPSPSALRLHRCTAASAASASSGRQITKSGIQGSDRL